MKRAISFPTAFLVALVFCSLTGCASSYSVKETSIRSSLPDVYATHTASFILNPTDADVQLAVNFGRDSKEKPDRLSYAYLFKSATSAVAMDSIYISIQTPLYLIAKDALDQAREFRQPDPAFATYARKLNAVRLSISQAYMTNNFQAVAFQRRLILLRDGVRVDSLKQIQAWSGASPFRDNLSVAQSAAMERVAAVAAQYARASMANMSDEQKQMAVKTLSAQGLNTQQISSYTGLTADQIHAMAGISDAGSGVVLLTEDDAVFAENELAKPGAYEIVFREPKFGMLGDVTQKEIRLPISFAGYR